jgi:uncharacterized BrkB/YihY/UPF0761 family membrane protein
VGLRTFLSFVLCAAAAGAVAAHVAIDFIGDYALAHDSYDSLAHDSRALVGGIALAIAVFLAARGLSTCCAIALRNRTRLPSPPRDVHELLAFVLAAVCGSALFVPAMEWLDGRLAGAPVRQLDEAFGGSLLLGMMTTVVCATAIAALLYALARWLISYRDAIAVILETLLGWSGGAIRCFACDLGRCRLTFRCPAPHALRLSKRGPPVAVSA